MWAKWATFWNQNIVQIHEFMYYDEVITIENNRQVRLNISTTLVKIFHINILFMVFLRDQNPKCVSCSKIESVARRSTPFKSLKPRVHPMPYPQPLRSSQQWLASWQLNTNIGCAKLGLPFQYWPNLKWSLTRRTLSNHDQPICKIWK